MSHTNFTHKLTSRHATVVKDGYEVPLIGIPPGAVLETCDLCGNQYGMTEMAWRGKQMLCKNCDSNVRMSDGGHEKPELK